MNSELTLPNPSTETVAYFKEDAVIQAICEPARRKILLGLVAGNALGSAQLAAICGRNPDLTRKHLAVLRDLGMIVAAQDDLKDGRRQLYRLSPRVMAIANPGRAEIDFGFCLVRLAR